MKTETMKECIHIEHLNFSYEREEMVLRDVNLVASSGESIGLIGANGIGKSTLLKLLVGLNLHYEGKLEIATHPMTKENLNHIREHIGYVFQDSDSQLFMTTVEEDVAFGPQNYGLSPEEVEERVQYALSKVHLTDLRKKHIYKMSGGEKKLASIATILAMRPDIVLMDEPSVALDPRNRRRLINILNEMPQMKLIASHDLDFILDTCERTILMDEGTIIFDGKTSEVMRDKDLLELHGLELPLRFQD
ncbi:cobalt/nickel transport system ATP-binding protein [Lachnospiraceae bacterium A10]|nr:cobalt/nickel transport system ATP-binding protein [Lachnospiraceae bacterium A10]